MVNRNGFCVNVVTVCGVFIGAHNLLFNSVSLPVKEANIPIPPLIDFLRSVKDDACLFILFLACQYDVLILVCFDKILDYFIYSH